MNESLGNNNSAEDISGYLDFFRIVDEEIRKQPEILRAINDAAQFIDESGQLLAIPNIELDNEDKEKLSIDLVVVGGGNVGKLDCGQFSDDAKQVLLGANNFLVKILATEQVA